MILILICLLGPLFRTSVGISDSSELPYSASARSVIETNGEIALNVTMRPGKITNAAVSSIDAIGSFFDAPNQLSSQFHKTTTVKSSSSTVNSTLDSSEAPSATGNETTSSTSWLRLLTTNFMDLLRESALSCAKANYTTEYCHAFKPIKNGTWWDAYSKWESVARTKCLTEWRLEENTPHRMSL